MKIAFNIGSSVLSIIFIIVIVYYQDEVSSARLESLFSSFSSFSDSYYTPSYSSYNSFSDTAGDLTEEVGLISIFFFLYFLFVFIFNMIKVKTKTNKVFSIIGFSLTGIWMAWNFLMIGESSSLSFDEIAPGFIFYAIFALAASIVGIVQVGVHRRKQAAEI